MLICVKCRNIIVFSSNPTYYSICDDCNKDHFPLNNEKDFQNFNLSEEEKELLRFSFEHFHKILQNKKNW